MQRSRRYKEIRKNIEDKNYSLEEAVKIVKENATAKFDESVEVSVVLGVDPKQSDQMVRGNLVLPHGTGKTVKVAVVAEKKDAEEAKKAGADITDKDKIFKMINNNNLDFDVLLSTPQCMKDLGKLGRVLGPKGLMPSPKSGTVVKDVAEAVNNVKKGQVEFKMDKNGVINGIVGKVSFSEKNITDNALKFLDELKKNRPPAAKGKFLRKITVSSTMGPSVSVSL